VIEGNMSLEEIASAILGSPTAIQTNATIRGNTSSSSSSSSSGQTISPLEVHVQGHAQQGAIVSSSYLLSSAALASASMGMGAYENIVISSSYLYQSSSGLTSGGPLSSQYASSTPIVPGAIVVVRLHFQTINDIAIG
jgi:hypothetical protein